MSSVEARSESGWTFGRIVRTVLGVEAVILLALAQVIFAGYRLGVGNQSIQIPFLKHWADPTMFANDPMVRMTLGQYHSYFFKILAGVVGSPDVEGAYFWLHVLTAAAALGAAYALGRAMFRSRAAAVVLMLLMLAGHHRALAGDDLYSPGFTHTWAVFPLAIWAMALFYKERYWAAFALAGVIFNLHALTAAYLVVMFAAWAVVGYRPPAWRWRLVGLLALFALIASPTLAEMLSHGQAFDAQWLAATRVRSADHSFPTSWWTGGSSDVPRFALMAGLAALSLSFGAPGVTRRKSLWMAAAVGALFVVGLVFSEAWPVTTVVRAQLFRSSRLVMVLMLAHVAHGVVRGWAWSGAGRWLRPEGRRAAWRGSSGKPFPGDGENGTPFARRAHEIPVVARALEVLLATATFWCVAAPGMFAFAPWLLLAGAWVATVSGRLSWQQAAAVGAALFVTAAAWATIDFHVPGLGSDFSWDGVLQRLYDSGAALQLALLISALAWAATRVSMGPRLRLCAAVVLLYACVLLGLYGRVTFAQTIDPAQRNWVAAQLWAAQNTPRDAVFLTPPQQGGFRIYSGRPVVCEWRDGTQLYFSAAFAKEWWNRLTAIRAPSAAAGAAVTATAATGDEAAASPRPLEKMTDEEIVALAATYGASYVVLPTPALGEERELKARYENGEWTIYEPRIPDLKEQVAAEQEKFVDQETFLERVALPNIEKYRKSNARVELSDAAGRTILDGEFRVTQTRQAFNFGVSIPFFDTPAGERAQDFEPPPVTAKQLERVKAVFNYTVIPFSAKWQRIEPAENERHYEELDKYVDWCTKNGIEMEFHYLSGFTPRWVRFKTEDDQKLAWLRHCRETVERYHDRIKYWQVVNDERLFKWAVEAFTDIRKKYPDLKLGISDCSTFYTPRSMEYVTSLTAGLDEIKQLQAAGVKVDFFATHGHKPMGVWPDMRLMYACLDEFARAKVKIHISEATLDTGMMLVSPADVLTPEQKARAEKDGGVARWTPELAAEFYERFYTVAFSHPGMESINYWDLGPSLDRASAVRGMGGGGGGGSGSAGERQPPPLQGGMSLSGTGKAGMLEPDDDATPRPLYTKLKELIRVKWMTRLTGEVGGDGVVEFRGFHGDYEIAVRTPDGRDLRGRFTVKPDSPNVIQLKLGDGAGSVATGN